MKHILRLTLLAALTAAMISPGSAGAAERLRIEAPEPEGYPTVDLTVTAPLSLAGKNVPATAFALKESGDPRQVAVKPLPAEDLQVVLVVDTSGSMRGAAIAAARDAAAEFVTSMPRGAQIAIVSFSDKPTVASEFSTDRGQLQDAIASLDADGETALYDGVITAVAQFPQDVDAARSVVLLSDGGDTVSKSALSAAESALSAAGSSFHAIELRTAESDRAALGALAKAADGQIIGSDDAAGLTKLYRSVASVLSNQYVLSYDSSGHGATPVDVTLTFAGVTATGRTTIALPAPPPGAPAPKADVEAAPQQQPAPAARPSALAWMQTTPGLMTALAAFFGAMLALFSLLFWPSEGKTRLADTMGALASSRQRTTKVSGLAVRATTAAERTLERRGWSGSLNAALEQAGLALRPGEFLVLVISAVVTAYALGVLLAGMLTGLLLAVVAAIAARLYITIKRGRRNAKFSDQLSDTLQLLAGSLRAGHSFLQAIDSIAQESDAPTAEEFRRLVVETRLGRDMNESLAALAARMDSRDFEWVVQAIAIHREVGGDLAEVLDTVAGTIRQRAQLRRQVKALSAEGRLSAYILAALPFAMALVLRVTNPEYLGELTTSFAGWLLVAVGACLMTAGIFWLRKIVKIVF